MAFLKSASYRFAPSRLAVLSIAFVKFAKDKVAFPIIISPENLRIDPASDWSDPMESSPYIIHLIPMYVQDVIQKMEQGEWKELSIGELLTTSNDEDDNTTRLIRDEPRENPLDNDSGYGEVEDYKIVWIHKNIIKKEPQPLSMTESGGKIMANNTLKKLIIQF